MERRPYHPQRDFMVNEQWLDEVETFPSRLTHDTQSVRSRSLSSGSVPPSPKRNIVPEHVSTAPPSLFRGIDPAEDEDDQVSRAGTSPYRINGGVPAPALEALQNAQQEMEQKLQGLLEQVNHLQCQNAQQQGEIQRVHLESKQIHAAVDRKLERHEELQQVSLNANAKQCHEVLQQAQQECQQMKAVVEHLSRKHSTLQSFVVEEMDEIKRQCTESLDECNEKQEKAQRESMDKISRDTCMSTSTGTLLALVMLGAVYLAIVGPVIHEMNPIHMF